MIDAEGENGVLPTHIVINANASTFVETYEEHARRNENTNTYIVTSKVLASLI